MYDTSLPTVAYSNVEIKQLIKEKMPVKITGFKINSLFCHQKLLNELNDFKFSAARLKNKTLHLEGKDAMQIKPILGREFLSQKNLFDSFFISEPITHLPQKVFELVQFPFDCDKYIWCKSRLWLASDSHTPLHQDIPNNLMVVTEGAKDVILVAPTFSRSLYRFGLFSKSPNFSRVNIRKPDYERFAKLKGVPFLRTQINKGEILFIPPFWWHDVQNQANVTSLNFWFAPIGIHSLLAALAVGLKSLTGIYRPSRFESETRKD